MADLNYSDFDPDPPELQKAAQDELARRQGPDGAQKGSGLGSALGIIGSLVGTALGGPAGAAIGGLAGKTVGGLASGQKNAFPGAAQLQGAIDTYGKQKAATDAAGEMTDSEIHDFIGAM